MQQLSCEIVSQPSQSQPSQNVIPLRLTTSREKAVAGIDELFGVDLRALAVFRIAMGLVTAADLIIRSRHLFTHYTDQGILPRVALIEKFMPLTDFSFHLFMGTVGGQAFLFLIAGILSLLLIVGYKTRLVTFLSWVFLISLQNRNPMVNHSGDVMLRLLYFWSPL